MIRIWLLALQEWRRMGLASLWGFLTIAASIGLLFVSGMLLTRAAYRPSIAELSVLVVGVRFFGLARGGMRWLERMASHDAALRLLERFRLWFYRQLEPLVPYALRHTRHGELFHALGRDVDSLEFLYARVIAPPLVTFLVVLSMGLLFAGTVPALFVVWLSTIVLAIAGCFVLYGYMRSQAQKAHTYAHALQSFYTEMRSAEQELRLAGTWQEWLKESLRCEALHNDAVRRGQWGQSLGDGWVALCTWVGLLAMAYLLFQDPQMASQALSPMGVGLLLASWASMESLVAFPGLVQALVHSGASGRRLLEIADLPSPAGVVHAYTEGEIASKASAIQPLLKVQDLSFRWPDGELLFSQLSLELAAGERVALLGDSGFGKSTIFAILQRFLVAQEGRILLQGRPLDTWSESDLRTCIAVLDQTPHLFTGSLADNLRIAKRGSSVQEREAVLRQVGLWDWAHAQDPIRPENAWIGEQGRHLSGGQRQRLAAAQVLLRNAPLVLLDEPAAHLDSAAESLLLDLFCKNAQEKGHALLVITHRPEFLPRFDRIVRLSGVVASPGQAAQ